MRALSENFMADLKEGILKRLLDRVKRDDTLMLSIRTDYVNIYYRGGSILRITEKSEHRYVAYFDPNYCKGEECSDCPELIKAESDINAWISAFPRLKEVMDFYFYKHPKLEREFQQLVVRENNNSSISNASEYFITDIEFADAEIGARFDLTAIRWLANDRIKAKRCRPVFIEMKYGDDALDGTSGMIKHLEDFSRLVVSEKCEQVIEMMESQFRQMDELGLIDYKRSDKFSELSLRPSGKPEVVFLLANHNPRSEKLRNILYKRDFDAVEADGVFDLRFYVSSFAGYGMHSDNMLPLAQMRKLLDEKS